MAIKSLTSTLTRRAFGCRLLQLSVLSFLMRDILAADEPQWGQAGDYLKTVKRALNGAEWEPSHDVILKVPELAENGAIVPASIESLLPDTRRILLFAEKNPRPLLAEFKFEPGADPWVSLRIKLNDTGPVLAIAEAGGKFYGTVTEVKVLVGGCG